MESDQERDSRMLLTLLYTGVYIMCLYYAVRHTTVSTEQSGLEEPVGPYKECL